MAQWLIIVYFCSVNAKEEVLRVSHRLLIDLPPTIHTFKPGGTVTVRVGSKVRVHCTVVQRQGLVTVRVGSKLCVASRHWELSHVRFGSMVQYV